MTAPASNRAEPTPTSEIMSDGPDIEFHFFTPWQIGRIAKQAERLSLHARDPEIVEVGGGIVPPERRPAGKILAGVYEVTGELVESSLPFRGNSIPSSFRQSGFDIPRACVDDPRTAYFLGMSGAHYGHFLLETLSRAWAWRDTNTADVALIQLRPAAARNFMPVFLGLIPGLQERITVVTRPTRFSRVLVPKASFVVGREAYRVFKTLCERIATQLLSGGLPQTDQPLYLSRAGLRPGQRTIIGEARLEEILAGEGFLIARPERLPVAEQIRLVNTHRWVVASMGSACHNRLFSCLPTTFVMLSPANPNPNYLMCDELCEGPTHYVNSLYVPRFETAIRLPNNLEPLVLNGERCLTMLVELGLIRKRVAAETANFAVQDYVREWVRTAEIHARASQRPELAAAARQLARTIDPKDLTSPRRAET